MKNKINLHEWINTGLIVLGVILLAVVLVGNQSTLGGTTADDWSANSFQVNGTTVIDSSSNLTITGTSVVDEFTEGGGVLATSTANTSETLTASDLASYNVLDITPNTGNLTWTLQATSSWSGVIPNAGDYRKWVVRNATTSAITVTLAAGSGIDLQEPDGQNAVIGQNNFGWLTCYRKSDTDVVCRVDETIPAD